MRKLLLPNSPEGFNLSLPRGVRSWIVVDRDLEFLKSGLTVVLDGIGFMRGELGVRRCICFPAHIPDELGRPDPKQICES